MPKLHTTREDREQYARTIDGWMKLTNGKVRLAPPDPRLLCEDCNALETALADSQTRVQLLQAEVERLKAELVKYKDSERRYKASLDGHEEFEEDMK